MLSHLLHACSQYFTPFWGQVFETITYSVIWLLSTVACIWLRTIPDGGHKTDLAVGSCFCGVRTMSQLLYAWDLVDGTYGTLAALHWIAGYLGWAVIVYGIVRIAHVAITLRRSEKLERLRQNAQPDNAWTNELLPSAAADTRRGYEQLLREDVSTWQNPSAVQSLSAFQHSSVL